MIRYTIEKRNVLSIGQAKFYPKIVRGATMPMEEIAELLQLRTTLTEGEVKAFLNALSYAIRFYVTSSYVVEVEGLGIFSPSISATPKLSQDMVNADTITRKSVNYRPTSKMKSKFQQTKFTKANLDTAHL